MERRSVTGGGRGDGAVSGLMPLGVQCGQRHPRAPGVTPPPMSQPFAAALWGTQPARLLRVNSTLWARRSPHSPRLAVPPVQPKEKPGEAPPSSPSPPVVLWYLGGDLEEGQSVPQPPEEPGSSLEAGRAVGDSLRAATKGPSSSDRPSAQQSQPAVTVLALRGPGPGGACWVAGPGSPRLPPGAGASRVPSGGRRLRRLHHTWPADELPPVRGGEAQGAAEEAARHLLRQVGPSARPEPQLCPSVSRPPGPGEGVLGLVRARVWALLGGLGGSPR